MKDMAEITRTNKLRKVATGARREKARFDNLGLEDPVEMARFPTVPDRFLWRRLLVLAAQRHRRQLTSAWLNTWGNQVRIGPFAGLQLSQTPSWGDGDILPKLIGTYEAELHSVISRTCQLPYSKIVNIGCAEGFYAVGFARALPMAHVVAFDSDRRARQVCISTAMLNGVSERLSVMGRCTVDRLASVLTNADITFLLADCEGAEEDLLSLYNIPALAHADMLIECHDFVRPNVSAELCDRFRNTHLIDRIYEDCRPLDRFPALGELSSIDRAVAMCEWRPTRMNWIYCRSLAMTDGLVRLTQGE